MKAYFSVADCGRTDYTKIDILTAMARRGQGVQPIGQQSQRGRKNGRQIDIFNVTNYCLSSNNFKLMR